MIFFQKMKYLIITLFIVGVYAPSKEYKDNLKDAGDKDGYEKETFASCEAAGCTCPPPKLEACETCEPPTDTKCDYEDLMLCREEPKVTSENCLCPSDAVCVPKGDCKGVPIPK